MTCMKPILCGLGVRISYSFKVYVRDLGTPTNWQVHLVCGPFAFHIFFSPSKTFSGGSARHALVAGVL